jgi:hypothetical protein
VFGSISVSEKHVRLIWRVPCLLAAWVLLLCGGTPVLAQDDEGLVLRPGAGRAGTGFYTPGHWNLVRSTAGNPSSSERSPLLGLTLETTQEVQFTKRLWLPAQSQLTTLTPILLTDPPPGEARGITVSAQLIEESGGREVATRPDLAALPVRRGGTETAVLSGGDADQTGDLLALLRASADMTPTTAYLSDQDLPPMAEAWSNVDVLVISRTPNISSAQVESIRRWVVGGGRLWINLQQADERFARRLLGEKWDVAVIDRVQVVEGQVEWTPRREGDTSQQRIRRDYPVELVRVTAPGMRVTHRLEGYPVAMTRSIGNGAVLVTTLEAAGWMDGERITPGLEMLTDFIRVPRPIPSEGPSLAEGTLQSIAQQQIGYRVIGRTPVLAVLGLFTLALLVGGLWLSQRGELARLGWAAPAMAVVAAGVLLILGQARQSVVPFTLAEAQLLEPLPGEAYGALTGLVSVYTPPGAALGDARLSGDGPLAWPDLPRGGRVRLVWTGERSWHFRNLPLREGAIQTAQMRSVVPLASPVEARLGFTATGVAGGLEAGELGVIEDPVIMTPTGKLVPRRAADNQIDAPFADALAADQFYAGTVLGQREQGRQEVYRSLAADPSFPTRPVVVGWSTGVETGVSVSDAAERQRDALVAMPIRLMPPTPGETLSIPSAFMPMRPTREAGVAGGSPVYDERTRSWVTNISQAQAVLMAFDLPEGFESLRATGGRLTIELEALGRSYEVVVRRGERLVTAGGGENPRGTLHVELTEETAPDVRAGSVIVGVRIGESNDPLNPAPWSMRRMELGITGVAGGEQAAPSGNSNTP